MMTNLLLFYLIIGGALASTGPIGSPWDSWGEKVVIWIVLAVFWPVLLISLLYHLAKAMVKRR